MTASPPGMAGVFDRAAGTCDAVGVPWFGPIARGLVEELDVQPGERVLDLGCGREAALLPLARAAGPTGRALGIDLVPRMVALLKGNARDLPQVEVRVGDASAPDVEPEAYDVVSCCLVLRCGRPCRRTSAATCADARCSSWARSSAATAGCASPRR
jgi:SAM-dependent methyltransferase